MDVSVALVAHPQASKPVELGPHALDDRAMARHDD
jgi:hypothetical protein